MDMHATSWSGAALFCQFYKFWNFVLPNFFFCGGVGTISLEYTDWVGQKKDVFNSICPSHNNIMPSAPRFWSKPYIRPVYESIPGDLQGTFSEVFPYNNLYPHKKLVCLAGEILCGEWLSGCGVPITKSGVDWQMPQLRPPPFFRARPAILTPKIAASIT